MSNFTLLPKKAEDRLLKAMIEKVSGSFVIHLRDGSAVGYEVREVGETKD